MKLVALRGGAADEVLRTAQDSEDFEQEIVDEHAIAMAAAGLSDGHIRGTRRTIIKFARSLTGPLGKRRARTRSWPSSGAGATR
ncbi:hypothetical protein [Nesterenkonia salmonea]|uniref:hypothetical protein n=1 Tax=Nesterenkonia salmonea TaxID=1804987 RepID=UPI001AA07E93|nr:hypothetical protein [Nesterenkonia salmonea]